MTKYVNKLIDQLVQEALYEVSSKPLAGHALRNAMAAIFANKELFRVETIMELPEELRRYYLKTRKDTRALGEGSSRYVYKIGDDRVIKMAKSAAGAAQNKAEVDAENCGNEKYYAEVYEYSSDYSWIISELARPTSKRELEDLLGMDLNTLYYGLMSLNDQVNKVPDEEQSEEEYTAYKKLRKSSWLRGLMDMITNCDLEPGDVAKTSSWGVRKNGLPILIDYGLGSETYKTHYSKG